MGSAYNMKPYPDTDWWFVHEDTREKTIAHLYRALGGSPTSPADPRPEVINEAKP